MMIEFQVVGTKKHCGTLTSDAPVAEGDMQTAVEIGTWLTKQKEPFVTVVIYLPHGGRAFTYLTLDALAKWLDHALHVAAEDD
jgi:hypothetical protein